MFWLVLAILIAYGLAVVAPLLRYGLQGRLGALVAWCLLPAIVACPLLIPSTKVGLRAACAFVSADIALKMVDFFRLWGDVDRRIVLREFYRFLIPFPVLSVVYPDHKRRLLRRGRPWRELIRLVGMVLGGTAGFVIALMAIMGTSRIAILRSSFVLDHVVMLLVFVLAIESASRALCGIERLAGFDTRPIVKNAYLSRSVSEFWQRYNYRMHDWLYRNVFEAAGGRRAPIRSVLAAFLVSGIFHEMAFAMATSRITGYQLVFFTIQGPAALVSRRLQRLARQGGIAGKVAAHGATLLFLAITSVLFFHGASKVFPFIYVSTAPLP